MRTIYQSIMLLAIAGASCASAMAEDKPDAKAIVAKSIEAMGGAEAFGKITSRIVKGHLEILGMGVKGTIEIHQLRTGKSITRTEIEGIGTILQGVDGDVVWETNPMTGARIVEGEERALLLFSNRFDESNYETVIKTFEYVGEADVNGIACHKVVLTIEGLKPITVYYAKDTGLTAKTEMSVATPMGQVTTEAFSTDYRKVGDVLYPFNVSQKAAGTDIGITFDSLEHNTSIPDETFAMPDDVKALIGGGAAKGEAP